MQSGERAGSVMLLLCIKFWHSVMMSKGVRPAIAELKQFSHFFVLGNDGPLPGDRLMTAVGVVALSSIFVSLVLILM